MALAPPITKPRAWRAWRQRRRFLSRFVKPGMLVFDIGANVGEYAETFRQLGARVVAVEPNPDLAPGLFGRGFDVDVAAVADKPGSAVLRVGKRAREATISDDYAHSLEARGEALTE